LVIEEAWPDQRVGRVAHFLGKIFDIFFFNKFSIFFSRNLDPDLLYKKKSERKTFSDLLHDAHLGKKYISLVNDYFLSRGHLTAKSDFIYGAQQMITFYYINVAPQWQIINNGNWDRLETDVQLLAAKKMEDLEVYTGTYVRKQNSFSQF
jgi:DNA/RNA endonuclease G (NUC1)